MPLSNFPAKTSTERSAIASASNRHIASTQDEPVSGPDDPRDVAFHRSFYDPQNGCQQLSIFVQRPKGLAALKGSGGHVAIGIDNHFYDFGPRVFAFSLRMITGAPGSDYLQNYLKDFAWRKEKPQNKDLTVEEAYNFAGEGSPEYNTFVIPVSVTNQEARQVESYWKKLYARIENDKKLKFDSLKDGTQYQEKVIYKAFANQCTTEAHDSLVQAGLIPATRGLNRIVPGYFGSYATKNMHHSCGMMKGMAVEEVGVPLHPHSPRRSEWGQEIPDSVQQNGSQP